MNVKFATICIQIPRSCVKGFHCRRSEMCHIYNVQFCYNVLHLFLLYFNFYLYNKTSKRNWHSPLHKPTMAQFVKKLSTFYLNRRLSIIKRQPLDPAVHQLDIVQILTSNLFMMPFQCCPPIQTYVPTVIFIIQIFRQHRVCLYHLSKRAKSLEFSLI